MVLNTEVSRIGDLTYLITVLIMKLIYGSNGYIC